MGCQDMNKIELTQGEVKWWAFLWQWLTFEFINNREFLVSWMSNCSEETYTTKLMCTFQISSSLWHMSGLIMALNKYMWNICALAEWI
jgi:hypothetical protein